MSDTYPIVYGTVTAVEPFGVFVALDDGRAALLEVVNFAGEGPRHMTDYPKVGERLTAVVVNVAQGQPRLSMRPKDMERAKR